jgi:hypothetical protein
LKFAGPFASIEDLTRLGVRAAAIGPNCRSIAYRRPCRREDPPRLVCTSCGRRDAIECDPGWRTYKPDGLIIYS